MNAQPDSSAPHRAGQGTPAGRDVWVWLPREREGALSPAADELLCEGRALARRLGCALVAVGDRPPSGEEAARLGRWGVAEVRVLGEAQPPHPLCPEGRSPLHGLLAREARPPDPAGQPAPPRVALFAADDFGRVVAPLCAGERGAVFLPGVTGVTHDGHCFVAARPVLGEQFEAIVTVPAGRPLVATLLPGAVGEGLQPPGEGPPPAILAADAPSASPAAPAGSPAERPRVLPPDPATLSVADAERIVAFGRGAFSAEALALVERLATALGAVVAGTRPAADEGWLPFERQVGLTGAIVRPRLYVAVGISGAPYHMVGVKEPETLIAVNSDPEAPIFAHAHLGVVGDLHAVLPRLLERLSRGEALAPGITAPDGRARP